MVLCRGFEQRQGREINGLGWIGRVADNNGFGFASVAVQVNVANEILRVLEVCVLFRSAQSRAPLCLVFFLAALVVLFCQSSPLLLVFFYALGLALLFGGCFGLGFGFGCRRRRGLFALDL